MSRKAHRICKGEQRREWWGGLAGSFPLPGMCGEGTASARRGHGEDRELCCIGGPPGAGGGTLSSRSQGGIRGRGFGERACGCAEVKGNVDSDGHSVAMSRKVTPLQFAPAMAMRFWLLKEEFCSP